MSIEKEVTINGNHHHTNISVEITGGGLQISIASGLGTKNANSMSLKELHDFPIKEAIQFLQSVLDGTAE